MDGFVLTNADAQFVRKRLLLEIEIVDGETTTTLRYVEAPTPVHAEDWLVDSYRWTPYPFRPPSGMGSQAGDLSGVSAIQVPTNSILSAAHFGGTLEDATIRVYEAYFDPETDSQLAEETVLLSEGRLDEPNYDQPSAMFDFRFDSTLDMATIFVPRRQFVRICPFIHKGPGCQADGTATSCDHSYSVTGCLKTTQVSPSATGGNQARYGGFLSAVPA